MREQNTFCVCAGFWHDSNSIATSPVEHQTGDEAVRATGPEEEGEETGEGADGVC